MSKQIEELVEAELFEEDKIYESYGGHHCPFKNEATDKSKIRITGTYETRLYWNIDVPLGDNTVVEYWHTKHGNLYIKFVDGRTKVYEGQEGFTDFKYADKLYVDDIPEDEKIDEGQFDDEEE